jgi:hypothetical protein
MKLAKTISLITLLAVGIGCGYGKHATTPPSMGTTPNVSALVPNSANHGMTQSFTLTVNGTNFNGNAAINWNGAAQATTFVSSNQLTTQVPPASVATAGTVMVSVTNPGTPGGIYGGGTSPETSNSMTFTIN